MARFTQTKNGLKSGTRVRWYQDPSMLGIVVKVLSESTVRVKWENGQDDELDESDIYAAEINR